MAAVHRTRDAEFDLLEIYVQIARHNSDAAEKTLRRIDECCHLLARSPGGGTRRDDLAPGLRAFSVAKYVVYFRPVADGIEVIRVLRGARDEKRAF